MSWYYDKDCGDCRKDSHSVKDCCILGCICGLFACLCGCCKKPCPPPCPPPCRRPKPHCCSCRDKCIYD